MSINLLSYAAIKVDSAESFQQFLIQILKVWCQNTSHKVTLWSKKADVKKIDSPEGHYPILEITDQFSRWESFSREYEKVSEISLDGLRNVESITAIEDFLKNHLLDSNVLKKHTEEFKNAGIDKPGCYQGDSIGSDPGFQLSPTKEGFQLDFTGCTTVRK